MDAELVKTHTESALCSHNTSVTHNSLSQQAMNPSPAVFTCVFSPSELNNIVLDYSNKTFVEWHGVLPGYKSHSCMLERITFSPLEQKTGFVVVSLQGTKNFACRRTGE